MSLVLIFLKYSRHSRQNLNVLHPLKTRGLYISGLYYLYWIWCLKCTRHFYLQRLTSFPHHIELSTVPHCNCGIVCPSRSRIQTLTASEAASKISLSASSATLIASLHCGEKKWIHTWWRFAEQHEQTIINRYLESYRINMSGAMDTSIWSTILSPSKWRVMRSRTSLWSKTKITPFRKLNIKQAKNRKLPLRTLMRIYVKRCLQYPSGPRRDSYCGYLFWSCPIVGLF